MSSSIDISQDKLYKRRLTTLNSSTKFSNNNKSNSSIRRTQLYSNSSNIILPSINKSTSKHHSVLDSETLISKLIKNYKLNYNQPKNQTLQILKLNPIRTKKTRNTIMLKSQSLNDIFITGRNKMKYQSQRVLISNKNKSDIFFNNNYYYISKNSSESDFDDTLINENDLYSINNNNNKNNNLNNNRNKNSKNLIKSNSSSLIDNNILIHDLNKKNKINLKYLNLESNNYQNNSSSKSNNYKNYKRLRQFNKIFLNKIKSEKSKSKDKDNNLNKSKLYNSKINNNSTISEKDYISNVYENNIKFQAKLFEEHVRLLNNSYREYKNYYNDENFTEVFKTKALDLKIKYNKTIEDACSILYYLPKLILRRFYILMLNLINIQIPDEEKFKNKYITNEIDTVKKNNLLLAEIINYFNKTFEFYLILSEKENDVPELKLNQKNFLKIIKYIKTARYNIIYLNNSFLNSKKKFLDDLVIIKKFLMRNKEEGEGEPNNKKNAEDKISKFSKNILGNVLLLERENNKNISAIEKIEKQFLFEKDEETQKKKKIEIALDINKRKIIRNHLGKVYVKKDLFKSILWNKHLNHILKYCYDDFKNKIITEKITEQDKIRKGNQNREIIKFNFA